jgi:predicted ATPase with chaperone activity
VARTIADLDGVSGIETSHVAEALRYRPGDASVNAAVPSSHSIMRSPR